MYVFDMQTTYVCCSTFILYIALYAYVYIAANTLETTYSVIVETIFLFKTFEFTKKITQKIPPICNDVTQK